MNKERSSIIITAAITVAAALLIGVLIPVMSDGARFGGNASADLGPAVLATLAARQATVDASIEPDLPPLITPIGQAVAAQPTQAVALAEPTATPLPAPTPVPTSTPTSAPTPEPTAAPSAEATPAPTEAETAPAPEATALPAAEATAVPLPEATAQPEPEASPVAETPPPAPVPAPGNVVLPPESGPLAVVTISAESGMNVRSGPSTATLVLTALPFAAEAPAVGRTANSEWIQIYLANLQANGWVFASLVSVQGDVDALPIAE